MEVKSRYGIKVKFSCKMCAQSYFETVEDYIEHKRENHFTEFQKTKSFIILEEKTFPVDSYYKNENYKSSFIVERVSDSPSRSQSSRTARKNEGIESNDADADIILINDPISTKKPSAADRLTLTTPPSNGDKTEPVIEYETRGYIYTNPFTQDNSTENKSFLSESETIIPSDVDDGRNSPDPSYLLPKSELVVFEEQIQPEEDERSMAPASVEINQNQNQNSVTSLPFTPNVNHQSTDFPCKLCLKKFNSEPERKIHVNICLLYHPNRNSYCAECNELFRSGTILNRHRSSFHSSKTVSNSQENQETENVSSSTHQYYSAELESKIAQPVVEVEDAENVSSQYYSELEGAEDPDEEAEYILGVSVGDDDFLQKIPAPPPSKKSKPSPKIIQQYHSSAQQPQNKISSDEGQSPYPKPPFSYANLIALALKNAKTGSLRVAQIYKFISYNFPYYVSSGPRTWKSSLRTTLSLSRFFGKIEQPLSSSGNVTACRWAVDPSVILRMDDEIQRHFQTNPETIRAMRNPENSERIQRGELIGDLEGSDEDDDQDDDLSVITFLTKSQLTRRPRGSSSSAAADSSVTPETVTVPSTGSKSSNSAFILSQQHLHTVLNLPSDPPEKTLVKSEGNAEVTSASDFCEIISVQGNYLS